MTTVSAPAPSAAVDSIGAAPIVGVSPATLKTWRHKGIGPPYVVIGKRVRYRVRDLEAWLAERTVTPTPRPARAQGK
ncbi:helix-turn-helix transcriptional regulator [Mycobacterium persicum]|uniref:helix-turn-helix transcriptional regulator n=1 Tax=Mycobacterium persicum TaxID=1487726 RepID=UPI0009F30B32|nr:helix-turn-helix domain-containing protein [Mycobacterium persicum]ORB36283.1 hypothetical protein BST40_24430 [Mycobacterium persicum]